MQDRVLIVTYLFPPTGGVGVSRFVSYARYLPQHGCQPFVLTVRNPATPVYDYDLAKKVPPETPVFRAFSPEVPYALRDRLWNRIRAPKKKGDGPPAASKGSSWKSAAKNLIQRVFNPDVQVVWTPFALRAARRIIREHGITTVLVNLPPFSCLKIAAAVKREFPHLKLILDFRDEWIDNYLPEFDTAATRQKLALARKLERSAVESADFVAAVTESQLRQIRNRYPEQSASKFIYVPNGFDPDVYQNFHQHPPADGKIVVTYFGTVYAHAVYWPVMRYLDAVDALPEEMRVRIETRFIGRVAQDAAPYLENRRHAVRQLGFMSREAAVPYLEESSFNLMVSANPTTHAGKLFDYLGMGQPVLALAPPEGEVGALLRETRMGWCANPDDPAAIRQLLLDAFSQYQQGFGPDWRPDWKAIREYQWPNIVARMVRLAHLGKAADRVGVPA